MLIDGLDGNNTASLGEIKGLGPTFDILQCDAELCTDVDGKLLKGQIAVRDERCQAGKPG